MEKSQKLYGPIHDRSGWVLSLREFKYVVLLSERMLSSILTLNMNDWDYTPSDI